MVLDTIVLAVGMTMVANSVSVDIFGVANDDVTMVRPPCTKLIDVLATDGPTDEVVH